MINYRIIEIFTSEQARHDGKPVTDAVIDCIRSRKCGARCLVMRGIGGCYENGEVATDRLEVLSFNAPLRITVTVPAPEAQSILDPLSAIVTDGIIAVQDLPVIHHRAVNTFFPRQLRVRDVMTPDPATVIPTTPISDAVRLLLSSVYTGLPVVDERGRPIGVITQGDLISRGGLPIRLGLLAEAGDNRETVLQELATRRVGDAMSAPAITIDQNRSLDEAVRLMLDRSLKRLPVTDGAGSVCGMLSRLDIFRTVMHEAPDWNAFRAQDISVANLRTVRDITRRDAVTVSPDTTLDKIIRLIDGNDIQRVAVVDAGNKLLGLISDRDLLRYFFAAPDTLRSALASWLPWFNRSSTTAAPLDREIAGIRVDEVMSTDLTTIADDRLIEDAIRLMTEKRLKRLPVVDSDGRFFGMINRDSLLRTGFQTPGKDPS